MYAVLGGESSLARSPSIRIMEYRGSESSDTLKATAVPSTGVSQIEAREDDIVAGENGLEPGAESGEGSRCSSVAFREMVARGCSEKCGVLTAAVWTIGFASSENGVVEVV